MQRILPIVAVCLVSALMFFQNCGKTGGGGEGAGASSEPSPDPGAQGPVGTANFVRGQLFNYSYVPMKSQMVQTMIDTFGYYNYSGAKAVAIAENGLGFAVRRAVGQHEDARRGALEGCFAISGGKPCVLIADGFNFNLDFAGFSPASFTFTMTAPTTLSADKVPFLPSNTRTQVINDYKLSASPKALAVSLDGAYAWVAHTAQFAILSVAEARRVALERCELMAAFSPCTLFAENDTVVFNPLQINRTPIIDYTRTTMANDIPGMRAQVFTNNMTNDYLPKVTTNKSGAIYITADGRGGYGINDTAATADSDARVACEANKINHSCFRYAINQAIQGVAANLEAITKYSMNTHCKSMPRQTCAHHKQMGCPGGAYYTLSGGPVATENCP